MDKESKLRKELQFNTPRIVYSYILRLERKLERIGNLQRFDDVGTEVEGSSERIYDIDGGCIDADEVMQIIKEKQLPDYVDNNFRRPEEAGIYSVVNSDDENQTSYFNGSNWEIDTDNGEKPVKKWLEC